jgi:outer membrane protein assembly factor BamD (BamD/ComL family)
MESDVVQLGIADRSLAWFVTYKKPIIWTVLILLVAGMGTGFFFWRQDAREQNANMALSKLTTSGLMATEQMVAPEALLKITAEHPNTEAGGRALLMAAVTLYEQGKYPEAKAQFERYLRQYRESPFADQAALGVAASLDAQGKITEAVAAYTDLVQHHSMENVAPQARIALARLYTRQGKLQQAKDLYTELSRGSYGSIASEASIYLETLINQHPELASPRTAVTNAPTLQQFKP